MRAGRLSNRVTYQLPAKVRDALGDESEVWTTVKTFWARVRSPSGTEALNAEQIKAVATHVIEMRYPGYVPSPNGRFLFGTQVFNIRWSADPEGRRREILVFCEELVSATPQTT